ncbi:hypothetical protein STCU_11597 [Strigomonas culicis]|uniref:Cyclic nucleotide-binding domain-containing protein n=1 Tax=Strigomonas culicis TaxID=28005 RepID=S9UZS8_9TRYP|nr:hypothetical protein STCU_11597 [Strigomonas culicis]|eukprot:EPY16030.1 hypothetical protein STCU_11597 [Strigomonas culicis]
MDIQNFEVGQTIVRKGELNDEFFLILSGQAETHAAIESAQQETVPLGRGDTVGDIALMYAAPSEFTAVAIETVQCASLNRHAYKIITSRAMEERRQRYAALLDHVPYLSCLTPEERSNLAETLKEGTFSQGQRLICAGAPGNWIHIVVEGTLEVVGSNSNVIATLHEGDCAGHIEFLYGHLSVANVVVSSETAKTARIGKRMFDRLIGTAREVMMHEIEEGQSYEEYRQTMRSEARPQEDTTPAFDAPPLYIQSTLRQQEGSMRQKEESETQEE